MSREKQNRNIARRGPEKDDLVHAAGEDEADRITDSVVPLGRRHEMPVLTFFSGKLAVEYCMIESALQYEKQEVQRSRGGHVLRSSDACLYRAVCNVSFAVAFRGS